MQFKGTIDITFIDDTPLCISSFEGYIDYAGCGFLVLNSQTKVTTFYPYHTIKLIRTTPYVSK